jgi:hypothetical protein
LSIWICNRGSAISIHLTKRPLIAVALRPNWSPISFRSFQLLNRVRVSKSSLSVQLLPDRLLLTSLTPETDSDLILGKGLRLEISERFSEPRHPVLIHRWHPRKFPFLPVLTS